MCRVCVGSQYDWPGQLCVTRQPNNPTHIQQEARDDQEDGVDNLPIHLLLLLDLVEALLDSLDRVLPGFDPQSLPHRPDSLQGAATTNC